MALMLKRYLESRSFHHLKGALTLLKIKVISQVKTPEDRQNLVNEILDVSFDNDGSLFIKKQVHRWTQRLLADHSQESRIRYGLAYSLYYIVVDSEFYLHQKVEALDAFKELEVCFDLDEVVRGVYARSIENLIRDIPKDIANSRKLLARIKALHEEYPHCLSVLEFYSSSLFQLHSHEIRDAARQLELINELRGLYEKFSGNYEISLDYGIALHNSARSPYLTEDERISVLELIESWQAAHKPDDWLLRKVGDWQARALSNWDHLPKLQRKVAELALQHVQRLHDCPEVRAEFATGASFYLLSREAFEEVEQQVIGEMQKLYALHPDEEEVERGWICTLRAVALAGDESSSLTRTDALRLLRDAAYSSKEDRDALFNLAMTMTPLSEDMNLTDEERSEHLQNLSQISEEFFENEEFQGGVATACFYLYKESVQTGKPEDRYLDRIREICKRMPNDSSSRHALANALMNGCSHVSQPSYAHSCFEELKVLQKSFSDSVELVDILSIAYHNVFRDPYEGVEIGSIEEELKTLRKHYPRNLAAAEAYALVMASGFYGCLERIFWRSMFLYELMKLARKFSGSEDIQDFFAGCLLISSVIARSQWIKRRFLAEAQKQGIVDALERNEFLIPLYSAGKSFQTMDVDEVRELLS